MHASSLATRPFDFGNSIAVDSSGNAYVTGEAGSNNFPRANAFQNTFGGGANDGFVTKLNVAGSALVYSTYLGGSGNDTARSIAIDSSGSAYVTGSTQSSNFPTMNPLQPNRLGFSNAFVTKFNPAGSALVYSTYLGGDCSDRGRAIAVDVAGMIYVAGSTNSRNGSPSGNTPFPTKGPVTSWSGGVDASRPVLGRVFAHRRADTRDGHLGRRLQPGWLNRW